MTNDQRPTTRDQKLKLSIELVPSSSWQNNLRGILKPSMWDTIRKKVYEKYDYKCSICGSPGHRPEEPPARGGKLHAHEVWEYDDKDHIQKLADIIPLCYNCHMVKHIGFASLQASKNGTEMERFIKHFMKVNKCDRLTYQKHLKSVMDKYEERSKYEWQLDLGKLKDFED